MKNDIVLYKRIYQLLRNQIECGLLPVGKSIPSRAELCKEFQVSEKTVRRVLEELLEDGLIEVSQRKRPIVKSAIPGDKNCESEHLRGATDALNDIIHTGRLFCYPVIVQGVALCEKEDWEIPAAIIARMDPENGTEFWRLSHRFWRFFVTRNCNDLILRAVDSLGFFNIEPLPCSLRLRKAYMQGLQDFVQAAAGEGGGVQALMEIFSGLYGPGGSINGVENYYRIMPDAQIPARLCGLEQSLRSVEERYSRVYMSLVGLITIGRYGPGDRLPSHKELQKMYDVSSDTTTKAIRVLREWGVVTTKRGDGIYVSMDLETLKNVKISPDMIGCHLRRFLDSLELLTLTVDQVVEHTAALIPADKAEELLQKLQRFWNEEYLYQLTPMTLLEFITDYIPYSSLKEIYQVVSKNYHIGRCIPKLVSYHKTAENYMIQSQAVEAVECLIRGDGAGFSKKASAMFRFVHKKVILECENLGYLEIADKVYDGTILWKKTYYLSMADTPRLWS